jgi:4-alpha-glucanotransferase
MHTSTHSPGERHAAGVLLHPTSLPGRYGIGDLGDELIAFLDWAASAGMRLWQVLPLNPPGFGASPYGCVSSFAGNPLLISPDRLLDSVENVPHFDDDHVQFDRVAPFKFELLRIAYQRFDDQTALDAFINEQSDWIDDYALFMALKAKANGAPWWKWDRKLARREPAALKRAREQNADEVRFWQFVQLVFFRQWDAVREAARSRGIRIIGDVPIYVACDSADVWGHRELFELDASGHPTFVAGVPPDYFSETGQRWGNPLYRWDAMRETNFQWWIARVRTNLRFADLLRLDHFRGFVAYWEIPANEPTAVHGQWKPGPGIALFDALRGSLGNLPLIAEDLGFITQDVHELRQAIGVPGMRILQFGFGQNDSPHLPHRYEPHTVVYTGTHDNDTARGWYETASSEEREAAAAYLGCASDSVASCLIRAAYTSVAEMAIVPAQDILDLGSEARMNRPGATEGNWTWRVRPGALTHDHAARLRRLAELTGR